MIDFTKETPLPLAAVAERYQIPMKTVYVWSKGVRGRRLETAKLGGKRFTRVEAIQRFSCPSMAAEYVAPSALESDYEEATRLLEERHGAKR